MIFRGEDTTIHVRNKNKKNQQQKLCVMFCHSSVNTTFVAICKCRQCSHVNVPLIMDHLPKVPVEWRSCRLLGWF